MARRTLSAWIFETVDEETSETEMQLARSTTSMYEEASEAASEEFDVDQALPFADEDTVPRNKKGSDAQGKNLESPDETNKRRLHGTMLICLVLVVTIIVGVVVSQGRNNDQVSNSINKSIIGETSSSGGVSDGQGSGGEIVGSDSESNECIDQIASLKSCYIYQQEDPIIATFTACNPGDKDWVGIYEQRSNVFTLGDEYFAWAYTCGEDEDCGGTAMVEESSHEFNSMLGLGSYQLVLVVANPAGAPYERIVSSDSFVIANPCP